MGAGAGILIGCFCGLLGLFIILFVYALIIRAAVWISNQCLGGSGPARSAYYDDYDDDDDDDYPRPRRRRRSRGASGGAIPEPSLGKGMGIAFITILAHAAVTFVVALVIVGAAGAGGAGGGGAGGNPFNPRRGADVGTELAANCCSAIVGFFIWAGVLTGMLPTSFARASLVTLFIYIIGVVIGVIILVAVVAVAGVGALK